MKKNGKKWKNMKKHKRNMKKDEEENMEIIK